MEETLKRLNERQVDTLKTISTEGEIEQFYKILNYHFGDGEVLPFDHVMNVFEKKISNTQAIGYYIDSLRILSLLKEDTEQLKELNINEVIPFHDELSKKYNEDASEALKQKLIESLAPYDYLNNDYGTYKTQLISTLEELDWEGKFMNHCIATYRHIVANGKYVGVKFFNENSWERLTIGFRVNEDGSLVFDQLKAHSNYPATKESCEFAVDFCEKNNIECNVELSHDLHQALNVAE